MVPGLDKLKKDYDDIGVSYINSYKRENQQIHLCLLITKDLAK